MVLILVDEITNRLSYTFDFIFKSRSIDFELTINQDDFTNCQSGKLNYSNLESDVNRIQPSQLLFEVGLNKQEIDEGEYCSLECLSFSGVIDPVASIFYILTRYEEYTCSLKDEHNRFPFSESVLKKFNWIELAVCDRWAIQIIKVVGEELPNGNVEIIPTFDIDNTYAYKLKSGKQKYLSLLRDVVQLNYTRLSERYQVKKGQKDPYDSFEKIKEIAQRFPKTKLFWLVGKHSEKDRNIPITNSKHQELIKELNEVAEVNLHPSYSSNGDVKCIVNEKESLERVLGNKTDSSRQHYLRFQLPKTYQSLLKAGFTYEYSMGFAEHVGFRCGTSRSHFWFDLSKNEITNLTIQPFIYMDGSLNDYMNLKVDESKKKVKQLYDEVEKYGGDFVFLWHNETIGNYGKWKGWSELLDYTLTLKDE